VTASAERISPLADWPARFAAASDATGHFSIREVAFSSQLNLRGSAADPAFATAVSTALGCHLPASANTWSGDSNCAVLWLGQDEWLVAAPGAKNEALCSGLRAGLSGLRTALSTRDMRLTLPDRSVYSREELYRQVCLPRRSEIP
jgi:sarcosine oxidase gamma subunit